MRIGVLAEDFPPQVGGMAEHARHLALELSRTDDVVVYTRPDLGMNAAPFEQRRVLTSDLQTSRRTLQNAHADAWIVLNAGYSAIADVFTTPVFAYFHGNDFLSPNVGYARPWIDRLEHTRFFWRYQGSLHRYFRRRDISRGLRYVNTAFTNSTISAAFIRQLYARHSTVVPRE